MTKREDNYNQSCDSSNGSASLEEQKMNSVNTDHENFAIDDAYKIDKSLTMEYRVRGKGTPEKRRRRVLVTVVVLLALVLVIGVITYICIYVKRENRSGGFAKSKEYSDSKKLKNETDLLGICYTNRCKQIAFDLKRTMNLSADPCENFHEFACGKWDEVHPLPAYLPKLDTMELLKIKKKVYLKTVIEQESKKLSSSSFPQNEKGFKSKILTYYKSCIDLQGTDRKKGKPLLNLISSFGRWSPVKSWEDQSRVTSVTELLVKTHRYFTPSVYDDSIKAPLFKTIVKVNDNNSSQHVLELNLPDFPLNDLNDYFHNSSRSKKVREKYRLLKTNYVALLGPSPGAKSILKRMWKFELAVANASMKESWYCNDQQSYNFTSIAQFGNYVGDAINWEEFVKGLFKDVNIDISSQMKIGVRSINYFKALNNLIKATDVEIVKDFIIWVGVWKFGPYASAPYREANYNFQRTLIGVKERPKRWKTCIEDIEQTMEFGLSSLYVQKAITKEGKKVASEIVRNVTRQFKNNLVNVEWMDVTTKAAAFTKVDSIAYNIGYPEFVKNEKYLDEFYESVKMHPDKYLDNVLSMYQEKRFKNLKLIRQNVDRLMFELPPTLVEAYFDVNKNRMMFLAGILHAPFFGIHRPMAMNYGALGLVAGHEVTHAFDDRGRLFDAKGEKKDWWSISSSKQFRKRSSCMKKQYDNYTIYGVTVNGQKTISENIADNGGIKVAYMAYKDWERTHGKERLLPDIALTMDQLFFVSHGQVWCGVYRQEYVKEMINTDYHSPAKFRIIGPLSNFKTFSDTFKCKLGTPMNPLHKCQIW